MVNVNLKTIIILFILSYLFLVLGNGFLSLTNPDEVFYAQTAKEMIQHNSWLTPYLFGAPQFEKPIFLYWLLRIGFAIFGNNSFAVRFFPALFASLGVIVIYCLALMGFKNEKKAFISALILLSSGLYIGLARTVFTDMIFSVFILFALTSFYWSYLLHNRKGRGIVLFFIFSALAVLTKGPLGVLIPVSVVLLFLFINKDIKFLFNKYTVWGCAAFVFISFPWYIFMILKYGSSFTHEFFYNDHIRRLFTAEHAGNDKWYFYPFSMIGCMFPWSLFTLVALVISFKNFKNDSSMINKFALSWILVVFTIFQSAHSKLASYIFPFFPALALVTGNFVYNTALLENKNRIFFTISMIMACILFLFPVAAIIILPKYSVYLSSRIPLFIMLVLLLILAVSYLLFVLRYKFFKSIFNLACLIPVGLFVLPLMHKDIDLYASSGPASKYLMEHYKTNSSILCSKTLARGVRYYTDKEIAIIGIPESNFFSPHPIPFLGSDKSVKDYLLSYPVTFCVLKKSSFEDMERILGNEYKWSVLKIVGNVYILQVEHIKSG